MPGRNRFVHPVLVIPGVVRVPDQGLVGRCWCGGEEGKAGDPQSSRKAVLGSTVAALWAGSQLARTAMATRTEATPP